MNEEGFSLFEVLAAILLFAIVSAGIADLQLRLQSQLSQVMLKYHLLSIAEQSLDAYPYLVQQDGIRVAITTAPSGVKGCQIVTIQASKLTELVTLARWHCD